MECTERDKTMDKMMRDRLIVSRRDFLRQTSTAALVLPLIGMGAMELLSCTAGRKSPQTAFAKETATPPWQLTMVSDKEPGEPLIISGTIYAPDGRTPMEGIDLWVYHTDGTGHYSKLSDSGGDNRNTRLHGLMRTNAQGHYEFRTIKPAPYPGRQNPAHIHAYVSGAGYPEYWIDEYIFEGDPFITAETRKKLTGTGSFSSIIKLTRGSDGILRGVRDIKLEQCSNNCTRR
jgi:protocatechuate 3,4-dioxygenase, beta subunit